MADDLGDDWLYADMQSRLRRSLDVNDSYTDSLNAECDRINCTDYVPPIFAKTFFYILWGNWITSFLVTLIGIIYMYRNWVKHKNMLPNWPYSTKLYCIPVAKFRGILPRRMLTFILFLKIVPSLVIDVIDILFDNIYYDQMVNKELLNRKMHVRSHVYIILFTFQITGTVKNMILVYLANRQLTPKDAIPSENTERTSMKAQNARLMTSRIQNASESQLADTNAYMAITFYQTILAFWMQDAPEALTQYMYVDKYMIEFNLITVLASSARFLMSCRVMIIFTIYVKNFIDPAYHSLQVMIMLWMMVFVKFIIFITHGMRSYAVIHVNQQQASMECFVADENIIYQDPWSWSCQTHLDIALLVMCALSCLGVAVGLFVAHKYGHRIYNQSHYTGRVGIAGRAQSIRKISKFFRMTSIMNIGSKVSLFDENGNRAPPVNPFKRANSRLYSGDTLLPPPSR